MLDQAHSPHKSHRTWQRSVWLLRSTVCCGSSTVCFAAAEAATAGPPAARQLHLRAATAAFSWHWPGAASPAGRCAEPSRGAAGRTSASTFVALRRPARQHERRGAQVKSAAVLPSRLPVTLRCMLIRNRPCSNLSAVREHSKSISSESNQIK